MKIQTVNQLISVFKDIATRHYQINGFGIGETPEIGADKAYMHPVLWINPTEATMPAGDFGYKTFQINFDVRVFDLVNKDESNENEVLSDTIDILKDIIIEFKGHPYYTNSQLDIIDDINFESYTEFTDEEVSGWLCEITMRTPILTSFCGIPAADITGFEFPGVDCPDVNVLCPVFIDEIIGVEPIVVTSDGTTRTISLNGSGSGLEGTHYVFVSANGTDTENAIELQTAYDLAKTKKSVTNTWVAFSAMFTDVSSGNLMSFFMDPSTISFVSGQTYTIRLDGVEYTGVFEFGSEWDIFMSSVTAPDGNYSTFEILSQEILPSKVIVAHGYYNFSSDFLVDEDYVDIVSLDGDRSVIFNGSGTINVTADNIFLKGIDVGDKNFTIATNLGGLSVENCKGGDFSFGGDSTFGSNSTTVSGTFIDCEGGVHSFADYGVASGHFERCTAQSGFGNSTVGLASGTFIDCKVTKGDGFGAYGEASGLFINCACDFLVVQLGFAGAGIASGTFINCRGNEAAFGGYRGECSGVFENCVAGDKGFGHSYAGEVATLTGKLYYCRLKTGSFQPVSGGGITRYCIDGNNATNNQG